MLDLFMALLSFRGIDTPSLLAQGEQRRSFYFNINRDNSARALRPSATWMLVSTTVVSTRMCRPAITPSSRAIVKIRSWICLSIRGPIASDRQLADKLVTRLNDTVTNHSLL
jgi:hypothetical protein